MQCRETAKNIGLPDDKETAQRIDSDEQLIALWLQGRTKHTRRSYEGVVRKLRSFIAKPLALATRDDIVAFVDSLTGLSAATRARTIHTIRSIFAFGYRHGYLTLKLDDLMKAPKGESRIAERILSETEVLRMIDFEQNARNHSLLRMLYVCGLRVSELMALRWRHLNSVENGEGQVSIFAEGRKPRVILLPRGLWLELNALRDDAGDDDPVFPGRHLRSEDSEVSRRPLTTSQAWRIVKSAARSAGITREINPQCLRHSHVSHALARGCPVHIVQQSIGLSALQRASNYTRPMSDDSADSSSRYVVG